MTRLLSIQSHVAFGSVGNRAVRWAMAQLALPCDAIDTVQWSNHAGYARVGGPALDRAAFEAVERARRERPRLRVHPPAHGFHLRRRRRARDRRSAEALRAEGLGRSTSATWSWVTAAALTSQAVVHALRDRSRCSRTWSRSTRQRRRFCRPECETIADGHAACALLERGATLAIVTSIDVDADHLAVIAHHRASGEYARTLKRVPHHVVGTGDLFAALVTAWLMRPGSEGFTEALDARVDALREVIAGSAATARGRAVIELELDAHAERVRALA